MAVLRKAPLLVVAFTVAWLALGVAEALATVETGWPVGRPNPPRNAEDLVIDFESGINVFPVDRTIPHLRFSILDSREPWRYGDIRRGQYSGEFVTNGNFFASPTQDGATGRIEFPGGGATYFSALVSNASRLSIEGYDAGGNLIATSGWAPSNVGTGTFTRLSVQSPVGAAARMAYVVFRDEGDLRWVIDDVVVDAALTVLPVPGRSTGAHDEKFDLVFIPDQDYGPAGSMNTWLPTFLDHIKNQIDQRLGGKYPVTGYLSKFNFYYTTKQGVASAKTIPSEVLTATPWADAYVIVHTAVFGDSCALTKPAVYGAEGQLVPADAGRSFIHESGHGIFGLADEYDGNTVYFQPDPHPNIWATETGGRDYATSAGWNPNDIWKFTNRSGDWWKLSTTEYIMYDGTRFDAGWGVPAQERIRWFLGQYSGTPALYFKKSLVMTLVANLGSFALEPDTFSTDSPPDYLPGRYDFSIRVYSDDSRLLGSYGLNDPRIILGEMGYDGPTMLQTATTKVNIPYFSNGATAELVDREGLRLATADIYQFAVPFNDVTLRPGWNLVAGGAQSHTAGASLFGFESGAYRSISAAYLVGGKGYWVRFAQPTFVSLTRTDPPVSLRLYPGWNLIGNPTAVRLSLPQGRTAFTFDGTRYLSRMALEPGEGAWVRTTVEEDLLLAL